MPALPNSDELIKATPAVGFVTREAPLGDGYVRAAAEGIQNVRERYNLTWMKMPHADAAALIAFLKARQGVESIDWTPPDESTSRTWRCVSFKHPWVDQVNKQVSAVLVEFYGA